MASTHIERQVAFLIDRGWHNGDGTGDIIATTDQNGLVVLDWIEFNNGATTPRREATGLTVDQYAKAVSR